MSQLAIFQSVHKWLGLFVGVQLFLWTLSGLTFSLLTPKEVSGRYMIDSPSQASMVMPLANFDQVVRQYPDALSVSLSFLAQTPVFLVEQAKTSLIISTKTLEPVVVDRQIITDLANARFNGAGKLVNVTKETVKTTENRRFKLPVWRADFAGEENPSLYFDGVSGRYLGVKVDTWRVFDILWMLHIMDYTERASFNHPLIILVTSLTLFIALSGIVLLFNGISFLDFRFFRGKKLPIRITGKAGFDSEIFVSKHATLYDSLASVGFELPSDCGGGGSCGLCRVKLDHADSPTAADKGILSVDELAEGYRLACRMRVDSGLVVQLPESVLHQQVMECEVVSNEFVTPLIKELVLKLPLFSEFSFEPGEYVQLHCPPGNTDLADVEVPELYTKSWQDSGAARLTSHRDQAVLRAYSMANEPAVKGQLKFNVRLALPTLPGVPVGAASSYVFGLKPGDSMEVSGPFGYFHAIESSREMIFIGGGAGMPPLRSHILHQLKTLGCKRKIRFFYGARSVQEIFYKEEFDALAEQYKNFNWTLVLSEPRPEDDWHGKVGFVHQVMQDEYLNRHPNVQNCEFYYCGPPMMNKAVYQLLARLDVPRDQIKSDDFGAR